MGGLRSFASLIGAVVAIAAILVILLLLLAAFTPSPPPPQLGAPLALNARIAVLQLPQPPAVNQSLAILVNGVPGPITLHWLYVKNELTGETTALVLSPDYCTVGVVTTPTGAPTLGIICNYSVARLYAWVEKGGGWVKLAPNGLQVGEGTTLYMEVTNYWVPQAALTPSGLVAPLTSQLVQAKPVPAFGAGVNLLVALLNLTGGVTVVNWSALNPLAPFVGAPPSWAPQAAVSTEAYVVVADTSQMLVTNLTNVLFQVTPSYTNPSWPNLYYVAAHELFIAKNTTDGTYNIVMVVDSSEYWKLYVNGSQVTTLPAYSWLGSQSGAGGDFVIVKLLGYEGSIILNTSSTTWPCVATPTHAFWVPACGGIGVKLNGTARALRIYWYSHASPPFSSSFYTTYDPYTLFGDVSGDGVPDLVFFTVEGGWGGPSVIDDNITTAAGVYPILEASLKNLTLVIKSQPIQGNPVNWTGALFYLQLYYWDTGNTTSDVTVNKPIVIIGLVKYNATTGRYEWVYARPISYWELSAYRSTYPPYSSQYSMWLLALIPPFNGTAYPAISIQDPYLYYNSSGVVNYKVDDVDVALAVTKFYMIPTASVG